VLDYLLAFVRATRSDALFDVGISPRGAIDLLKAVRAWALSAGPRFCRAIRCQGDGSVRDSSPHHTSRHRKGATRADIDRVFEQVQAPA